MEYLPDWQQVLLWSSVVSIGAVLATIAGVPWVVRRLPADYFVRPQREVWDTEHGAPLFTHLLEVAKNLNTP